MTNNSICTTGFQPDAAADVRRFDSWFDPIEHAVRDRVCSFIEELIEGELAAVVSLRYSRRAEQGRVSSRWASPAAATAAGRER